MPIEIREVTINANIEPGKKSKKARKKAQLQDHEIDEIVDRVLEVMERKQGR